MKNTDRRFFFLFLNLNYNINWPRFTYLRIADDESFFVLENDERSARVNEKEKGGRMGKLERKERDETNIGGGGAFEV